MASSSHIRVGTRSAGTGKEPSAAPMSLRQMPRSSDGLHASKTPPNNKDTDRGGPDSEGHQPAQAPPLARPMVARPPPSQDAAGKPAGALQSTAHPNNLNLDLAGGHRVSCHRCGNMRKKNVLCNACPHIFCQRCAEKLVQEWGPAVFDQGCLVCKQMCCCADPRDTKVCQRSLHCYKKCVAEFKNKPVGTGASADMEAKPILVDGANAAAIVQSLVDRDEAEGGGGSTMVEGQGATPACTGTGDRRASGEGGGTPTAKDRAAKAVKVGTTPRGVMIGSGAPPPLLRPTPTHAHAGEPQVTMGGLGRQQSGGNTAEEEDMEDEGAGQHSGRSPADAAYGRSSRPLMEPSPVSAPAPAPAPAHAPAECTRSHGHGHSRKRSADAVGLPEGNTATDGSRKISARGGGLHAGLDASHPLAGYPDTSPVASEDERQPPPEGRPGVLVGGSGRGMSVMETMGNPFTLPLMGGTPMITPGPLLPLSMVSPGMPGHGEGLGMGMGMGMGGGLPSLPPGLGAPLASLGSMNSPGLQLGLAAGMAAGIHLMQAAQAQAQAQRGMGLVAGIESGPRGDGLSIPGSNSTSGYGLPLPGLLAGLGMSLATPLMVGMQDHFPPNPPPPSAQPMKAGEGAGKGQHSGQGSAESGDIYGHDGGLHSAGLPGATTSPGPGAGLRKGLSGMGLGEGQHKGAAVPEQDAHLFADLTPLRGTAGAGFR